jgi:thymidylate kinase
MKKLNVQHSTLNYYLRSLTVPTIALIGPDGAGKTTIARRLERELPIPVKYLYMGVNLETSNLVLPTTRLLLEVKRALGKQPDMSGPPDPTRVKPRPKGAARRMWAAVKDGLRLANRASEEWFRQVVAWHYQRRGYVVLFDRHFFADYYAYDIADTGLARPWSSRLHGLMLDRLYPKPDLLICLDAPADVLFARKGEGTPALLERRRQEYRQLARQVAHSAIVDAARSQDEVFTEVAALVCSFYEKCRGDVSPHKMPARRQGE